MSAGSATTRGQPLLVLATVLGVWLVGRVLLWAPPFPHLAVPSGNVAHAADAAPAPSKARSRRGSSGVHDQGPVVPTSAFPGDSWNSMGSPVVALDGPAQEPRSRGVTFAGGGLFPTPPPRAAGHQMLLAAAFSHRLLQPLVGQARPGIEMQPGYAATSPGLLVAERPLLGARTPRGEAPARLSGDAWILWRDGSEASAMPGVSSYGRSQGGAVLRYRLLSRHRLFPAAYVRVTRTLEGPRQSEVAAGLSLRPVPGAPVTIATEARVTQTAAGREVRPAAFAVAAPPPVALPAGLRGEAYVQAGYVGGEFETAFVDGQARIDRLLARPNEGEVRLGVAAWGGAQRGAARLDVGPSGSLAFRIGDTTARLAVDYRLRVAGDATPASGPAVTFSAGF